MPYDGHTEAVDLEVYDKQCERIEQLRSRRKNVFVFCNSGFQRSLPFLVHYLTAHHADEIPNIERAIDTILPQVDKQAYATAKQEYVDLVKKLLHRSA
jgi:hypothetical protein